MKRDMDLVRRLLLWVEEHDEGDRKGAPVSKDAFPDVQLPVLEDHIEMMTRRDLIEKVTSQTSMGFGTWGGEMKIKTYGTDTWRLLWEGHDFLDTIRDDGVWSSTKEAVSKAGGTATLETYKAVSGEIGKALALAAARAVGLG